MTALNALPFSFSERLSFSFQDREEAGQVLAGMLLSYTDDADAIVLGIPRGGVSVASALARRLRLPLDVFISRNLPHPKRSDESIGCISSFGGRHLRPSGLTALQIDTIEERETRELHRRETAYRGTRPAQQITGRKVILVDEGLNTGTTMRTAIAALRSLQPKEIVVALPVAAMQPAAELRTEVDNLIAAASPAPFISVARWYKDLSPVMDRDIRSLLERSVGLTAA